MGFNYIDSGPYREDLDPLLARGLKAFVWLGGYDNTSCRFEHDDAWIRSHVGAVAGHAAIGAYFIDNEPDPYACPGVYEQMRARVELVESIDPRPLTHIAIDSNSGAATLNQIPKWAGVSDLVGLNPYPCYIGKPCDYAWITTVAQAADKAGLRYWAQVQSHGDDTWRQPTIEELHNLYQRWRTTKMEGYLVFAWHWPDGHPELWLANNPALQQQHAIENAVPAPAPPPRPQPGVPVIAGAGDICGSPTDCVPTAALLDRIDPTIVYTTGDHAYEDGSAEQYASYYEPNWGRFKPITRPVPGNHDYHVSGAPGYFAYFGVPEYYSYDLGSWHLVALNSEIPTAAGSAQEQWLRDDLASTKQPCILAYWHRPRFSSGSVHGSSASVAPLWEALYAQEADLVLNGHDHVYERFAPQTPGAVAAAAGIRQFTVGTGGAALYEFDVPEQNSQVRSNSTHGVLKLTLHAARYEWQFVPVAGGTFTDSGSAACH